MFLVRFDDICPTMNWDIWDQIEPLLYKFNIKPILAVIPDNQDPTFKYHEERPDFWDRVRQWQKWGWAIGMHGYQHSYVTKQPGLIGRAPYSEFAGLGYEEQKWKLEQALAIFKREQIAWRIWVAPAHSFDKTTLHILKKIGITIISDGLSFRPYFDSGLFWVPVQVAKFRNVFSFCTWTVCLHHNTWTEKELQRFHQDIARFHKQIKGLDDILSMYGDRGYSLADAVFRYTYTFALRARDIQHRLVTSR